LIEGDNYHALSVLNYTHLGKIDIIYIDPPYNRGTNDFKYNDRFVEKTDTYRHSKWLSFMYKRLRLAKNLLSEQGVIFISIDENEFANLVLLCDDIFNSNQLGIFVWQKKYGGGNDSGQIATEHEYVVCYSKQQLKEEWLEPHTSEYLKRYSEEDEIGRFFWDTLERPGLKNPIKVKVQFEGKEFILQTFRSQKRVDLELSSGEIRIINIKGKPSFQFKQRLREGKKPRSLLRDARNELDGDLEMAFMKIGSNSSAKKELFEIFHEDVFDNPKPTTLISYLLKLLRLKKGIVLDYFAGSGSTGHSVLKDHKNFQFIICTNNESNICTEVCYPRIEKVIKGYKTPEGENIKGLSGNLKYFKTAFIKKTISRDDMKLRITRECTEMLCLREGIFNEVKSKPDFQIFEQNRRIMGVYYAMERDSLGQLKKELDKLKGEKILYCFTLDPLGLDKNDFTDWRGISLEPIPQKILDIYEQIYEY